MKNYISRRKYYVYEEDNVMCYVVVNVFDLEMSMKVYGNSIVYWSHMDIGWWESLKNFITFSTLWK